MRKILPYCHPSFSQENVKGVSNSKTIKSGRSLDLAYQLGTMTRRGDCHVASLLTMTIEGLAHPFLLVSSARQFLTPPAPSYIRGGVMGIIAMTAMLFSFNAHSACTPTPDCASIGYTEISCETDYLACPFDSTKLKCVPCDSSFRYDCSGDNIVGGTGSACGGKYVSCECSGGLSFNNGTCICPNITSTECLVGTIYYPNGKCSSDYISCQNPIGVVVKDNVLVIGKPSTSGMTWGGAGSDIDNLTNMGKETAKTDYAGIENTAKIVEFHTNLSENASTSAAIYCNEYYTEGTNAKDWYLPAAGELYSYVYGNYNAIIDNYTNLLGFDPSSYYFWSSTEGNYQSVHNVQVNTGTMGFYSYKTDKWNTVCFLTLN